MDEIWVKIEGSDDEVSSLGRVRRGSTLLKVSKHKVSNRKGGHYLYQSAAVRYEDRVRSKTVGSLVAEGFLGARPKGLVLVHINGDTTDDRVENLRWGKKIETLRWRGMPCERPTAKYPEGRRGTFAGYASHRYKGEEPCEECRAGYLGYNEEYYRENTEKIASRVAEWRSENRDYCLEMSRIRGKEHYQENKEQFYLRARKRRARLKGLVSEPYSEEEVRGKTGGICYLCGEEIPRTKKRSSVSFSFDHIHPLAREGCPGDILENVMPAHLLCNVIKGDKMLEEIGLPLDPPSYREWG